jgi:hypothetical protein
MLETYPWYIVYGCYSSLLEEHFCDDWHMCEAYTWYIILFVMVYSRGIWHMVCYMLEVHLDDVMVHLLEYILDILVFGLVYVMVMASNA